MLLVTGMCSLQEYTDTELVEEHRLRKRRSPLHSERLFADFTIMEKFSGLMTKVSWEHYA